jgi:mersacidin/lichenicidin family type 2 lantibiotic
VSRIDPVRAWKDPLYRDRLSAEERAALQAHPSGLVEIGDDELKAASGAEGLIVTTFRTCTEFTFRRFHCCP